jgi:ankyrin repeat protein
MVKELGADVNKADQEGNTPLYIAAKEDKLAIVQCLVKELSADVNQANDGGLTPSCVEAGKGDLTMMQCLVKELGTDVNKGNNGVITPLYMAAVKAQGGSTVQTDRGCRGLLGVTGGGDRRPFCVCDGKGVTGGVTANEMCRVLLE